MLAKAFVEHQIPGRIRLRVPDRRGDAAYFERVRQSLSKYSAVEQLRVSPITGCIIVHHSGDAAPVTDAGLDHGLFELAPVRKASNSPPALQNSNKRLPPQSSLEAVANGLAALALLQLVRGNVVGSAVENFWHAYGATRILRRPRLAALFSAIGAFQVLRGRYLGSATSLLFYSLATRQLASAGRELPPPSPEKPNIKVSRGQE